MIARSIVVYTIALSLLVVAVVCYRRRWSRSVALLISAAGCFIIVATVHVFEALSIFPAAVGDGREAWAITSILVPQCSALCSCPVRLQRG